VIAEVTRLARFVLGSGCLNTVRHREKNGQKFHHAVPTLPAALPVVAVIARITTVYSGLLIDVAVPHEDLGGSQLFPVKHLLQTVIEIVS
jgi:hypothetical protein